MDIIWGNRIAVIIRRFIISENGRTRYPKKDNSKTLCVYSFNVRFLRGAISFLKIADTETQVAKP